MEIAFPIIIIALICLAVYVAVKEAKKPKAKPPLQPPLKLYAYVLLENGEVVERVQLQYDTDKGCYTLYNGYPVYVVATSEDREILEQIK